MAALGRVRSPADCARWVSVGVKVPQLSDFGGAEAGLNDTDPF